MRPTFERIHSAQTRPPKPSLCAGFEVLIEANFGQAPSFSSQLLLFNISLAFVKHLRILTLVTTNIRWTCETLQPEFKKPKWGKQKQCYFLLMIWFPFTTLKRFQKKQASLLFHSWQHASCCAGVNVGELMLLQCNYASHHHHSIWVVCVSGVYHRHS